MFVNINVHSHYTLLNSLLSVKDIVQFSVTNKMSSAALTDVNNMFAVHEFFNECRMHGIKPIIGLEAMMAKSCYIFLAKNNDGYLELAKLSMRLLANELVRDADLMFTWKKNVFAIHKDGPKLNLGCEVYTCDQSSPHRIAVHLAKVLSNKDVKILAALSALQKNLSLSYLVNLDEGDVDYELWNEQKARKHFDLIAIENLNQLVEKCNVDLSKIKAPKLHYPFIPKDLSPLTFLQKLCSDNLRKKGIDLNQENYLTYKERLDYEVSVLQRFEFIDYFLIVWDLVNYAHDRSILIGPGRGSSAGSLIAYALSITAIDPVKNDLIFERFLNPDRISMPDIDLDVADNRREELLLYLQKRYGQENVALISTFQRIQTKSAIREAGRILKINSLRIEEIAKLISSTNQLPSELAQINFRLKKLKSEVPRLFEIADKLVGLPRQVSIHAAGVVIANQPLKNFVPLLMNTNKFLQTQLSYQYLDACGLIKIDLLGLKNLTILDEALSQSFHSSESNRDKLLKIPLDDQLTMKMLSDGLTWGVFQLESKPMTKLIQQIKPKTLEQLATVISLYRPGPVNNINLFISNAKNQQRINYFNQELKEILQSTNGIIVYQEQIMKIAKKIANFSDSQSDLFRRAISKKEDQTIKKLKNIFIRQAVANKYSRFTAESIYNYIEKFANYGFNRSHAFSYAMLSYWMAYIKCHYPLIYFSCLLNNSSLSNLSSSYVSPEYRLEMRRFKVYFALPSINESVDKLTVLSRGVIQLGFNAIKGLTFPQIKIILEKREQLKQKRFHDLKEVILFFLKNDFSLATVNMLIYAGALSEFGLTKKRCIDICSKCYSEKMFSFTNALAIKDIIDAPVVYDQQKDFIDRQSEFIEIDPEFLVP